MLYSFKAGCLGRHLPAIRRAFITLVLVVAIFPWPLRAQQTAGSAAPTNILQILSADFAGSNRVVRTEIRAVVTYADTASDLFFLADGTAGIALARTSNRPALMAGMEIQILGDAAPDAFAPSIREREIRILGNPGLPPARPVSWDQLDGGQRDSQWVSVEGVVQSVVADATKVVIKFSARSLVEAIVPGISNSVPDELSRLVDAKVRVRCVCGTRFNSKGNLVSPVLFVPAVSAIEVVEPPPAAPFELPLMPIAAPLTYGNAQRFGHRVRMSGVFTARLSPTAFFMQDASGGAYFETLEPTGFVPGDQLEAAAFPEPAGATPSMLAAVVRKTGRGVLPAPIPIDPSGAPLTDWDAVRVKAEGIFEELLRNPREAEMVLRSGARRFNVRLFGDDTLASVDRIPVGSKIAVTGVGVVAMNPSGTPDHFHVFAWSPQDFVVVEVGPWWTPARGLVLLGLLALGVAAVAVRILWREARTREQFRLIFDNATDLIATHDEQGCFLTFNASWLASMGFERGLFGSLDFNDLLARGEVDRWNEWWARIVAGAEIGASEFRMIDANGREVALEVVGHRMKEARGKSCIQTVARDATARLRTEAFRADQRKTLEMIATGAPLADILGQIVLSIERQAPGSTGSFLLLDQDGVTLRHGGAPNLPPDYCAAIDGMRSGEGEGSCGTAVARSEQVVVEHIATDPLWTNFRALASRHGLGACWSTPVLSRSGNVLGTFAIYYRERRRPEAADQELIRAACSLARIAIERKQAEDDLRRLGALQRAILDAAGVAIVSTDAAGTILSFNHAAELLLDYRAEDLLGRTNIVALHDPTEVAARCGPDTTASSAPSDGGSRPMLLARFRERGAHTEEWTYVARGGGRIPMLVSTSAMFGEDGALAGFVCVGSDQSERKNDEKTRADLEARLRQSEKMQAIGTLAGGIAHDFNNILGAMLGNAELLKMDLPDNREIQESLSGILKGIDRARTLVLQILAFSRSDAPETRPMSLAPVIAESLNLIRASLPSTHEIRTSLADTDLHVRTNRTQIHQLLMNLFHNSSHAMKGRPGRIELTGEVVRIGAGSSPANPQLQPGRYIRLSVSDNGHGMDEKVQRRIFEPFFTTKPPGEGTGLGLAVVHGIVKSHGGAVLVSSTPGVGTRFDVYFPAVEPSGESAPVAGSTPPFGNGERILVVDDEPELLQSGVRILVRLNYVPIPVSDPVEALARFLEEPNSFDLLLTDLTMPKMTGLDLARKVLEARPGLPVVLCTGHQSGDYGAEIKSLDVEAVLRKPFETEALAQALHDALRKGRTDGSKVRRQS